MSPYIIESTVGAELWSGNAASLREALDQAVAARANLAGANLADAYLARANLARANLAGATLARANLERANLADANLADANLAGANLERANLADATLAGATLARANLAGANLADAKGLRYAQGGWLLRYSWNLVAREVGEPRLRYGCEEFSLSDWNEQLVKELCKKHEPENQNTYSRAITALVAYCLEVDAVYARAAIANAEKTGVKP